MSSKDAGKDTKDKATAPPSPLLDEAASEDPKVEEIKEDQPDKDKKSEAVTFLSIYENQRVIMKAPMIVGKGDYKERQPGFAAQFVNGVYRVSPDKVWEGHGTIWNLKITGEEVIAFLRKRMKENPDFTEFKAPMGRVETMPDLVTRLKRKPFDEVKGEAKQMGVDVPRNANKESLILAMIEKQRPEENKKEK